MINIRPKIYNEALRLSRCLEMKKYIPILTDETTKNFDKIVLGAAVFNIVNTSTSSGVVVVDAPVTIITPTIITANFGGVLWEIRYTK